MKTTLAVAAALLSLAALTACDKREGAGQHAAGQIESGIGALTGDRQLKRDGKTDQVVGSVKSGDLKGAVKEGMR
jgi:uncharacterized protein YjbJ (UPF0337 family)